MPAPPRRCCGRLLVLHPRLDRRRRCQAAATTVLWLGVGHFADYLIYASLLGGALTFMLLQYRALPMPQVLLGREWAERLPPSRLRCALRHRARVAALVVIRRPSG